MYKKCVDFIFWLVIDIFSIVVVVVVNMARRSMMDPKDTQIISVPLCSLVYEVQGISQALC
jgi:hypothetical protein